MLKALFSVGFAILSFGLTLSATSRLASASDAVLLEFSSSQCKYCVQMKPVINQLEKEGLAVRRVNVDTESDMAVRFKINQLPTYVIVYGGGETSRLVGFQNIDSIRSAIRTASQEHRQATNSRSSLTEEREQLSAARDQQPQTRLASNPGSYGTTAPESTIEPMPSIDLAHAVARAEAATVRLRVYEDIGYGVGTGTVIDAHGDELLVLTCGHLFRDNKGKTKVDVEVFHGGQIHTLEGRVLDYDAEDRDIALVTVRTNVPVQPVPILPNHQSLKNGSSVFSFGCDRGANPSRRDTRITGINLYDQHKKLSNIQIAGAPIDGRSGGGLFDDHGNLIGVCNAADYDDDVGIYAGPGEVYWQLSRVRLQHLFTRSGIAASQPVDSAPATVPVQPASQLQPASPQIAANPSSLSSALNGNAQVIVVVRDPNNPQSEATVKVFDTPPRELLELLNR